MHARPTRSGRKNVESRRTARVRSEEYGAKYVREARAQKSADCERELRSEGTEEERRENEQERTRRISVELSTV